MNLPKQVMSAYRNAYDPAYGALCSFNADDAEKHSHCAEKSAHTEEQLCPSYPLDFDFCPRAHRLPVKIAIRSITVSDIAPLCVASKIDLHHKIGVRVPIELLRLDQRSILFRTLYRSRKAGLRDCFWVEAFISRMRKGVLRWVIVKEGWFYAHDPWSATPG